MSTLYTVTGDIHPPKPGEKCELCQRRVNHPKKESSPKSTVKSFRMPYLEEDDKARWNEDLARAMLTAGCTSEHKYPVFSFIDWLVDEINANPDVWAGAFTRYRSGEDRIPPIVEIPLYAEPETQGLA